MESIIALAILQRYIAAFGPDGSTGRAPIRPAV
jgi:hypothetical protein